MTPTKWRDSSPCRALLICNGEPPSRALTRRLSRAADIVVAADGGANVALLHGVRPDVIIGDLDSIRPTARARFASSLMIRLSRQDNTDFEKALDWLQARRVRRVDILGSTGRRIDFTLGNMSVLWKYTSAMRPVLFGDGWRAMPVERGKSIRARRGTLVSLIPFGPCAGVTLHGLRYGLRNARMVTGTIGVSNVVRTSPFRVTLRRGRLLLIIMDNRLHGYTPDRR